MIDPSIIQTEWSIGHAAIFALSIALIVSSLSKRRHKYPIAPSGLPLIGHVLQLSDSDKFLAVLTKWADQVGKDGVYEFSLFGRRYIVMCTSDTVMEAMRLRPYKLRRASMMAKTIEHPSIGIYSVFTAEGKDWVHQRKIVSPTLNNKNVKDYFGAIKLSASRLVTKWGNEQNEVCALSDLSNYSLDVVALAILGMDFDSLNRPDSEIAKAAQDVFRIIFMRTLSPVPYWRMPFIGPNLDGGQKASDLVLQAIRGSIRDYRERMAGNQDNGHHKQEKTVFLEKMVDLCDGGEAKLDDEHVMGNLASLIVAGTDTTSSTIAFCFWELAQDSELQEELYKEIDETGITLDDLTMNDVKERFPRVHSFMFEVLRVKGPAPMLFLEPAETIEFQGGRIEPGSLVVVLNRSLKGKGSSEVPTSPDGKGCQQFCPRRWLVPLDDTKHNGPVTATQPSNSFGGYMPFGYGVRICPGKQLAEVEVLTTLIFVLRNFEVSPMPNHPPITPVMRFTETFDGEMKLVLTRRQ